MQVDSESTVLVADAFAEEWDHIRKTPWVNTQKEFAISSRKTQSILSSIEDELDPNEILPSLQKRLQRIVIGKGGLEVTTQEVERKEKLPRNNDVSSIEQDEKERSKKSRLLTACEEYITPEKTLALLLALLLVLLDSVEADPTKVAHYRATRILKREMEKATGYRPGSLWKVSLQKFKRKAQQYADDPVIKRLLDTVSSSEGRADFDVTPLMAALTKIFLASEGLAFLVSFIAPAAYSNPPKVLEFLYSLKDWRPFALQVGYSKQDVVGMDVLAEALKLPGVQVFARFFRVPDIGPDAHEVLKNAHTRFLKSAQGYQPRRTREVKDFSKNANFSAVQYIANFVILEGSKQLYHLQLQKSTTFLSILDDTEGLPETVFQTTQQAPYKRGTFTKIDVHQSNVAVQHGLSKLGDTERLSETVFQTTQQAPYKLGTIIKTDVHQSSVAVQHVLSNLGDTEDLPVTVFQTAQQAPYKIGTVNKICFVQGVCFVQLCAQYEHTQLSTICEELTAQLMEKISKHKEFDEICDDLRVSHSAILKERGIDFSQEADGSTVVSTYRYRVVRNIEETDMSSGGHIPGRIHTYCGRQFTCELFLVQTGSTMYLRRFYSFPTGQDIGGPQRLSVRKGQCASTSEESGDTTVGRSGKRRGKGGPPDEHYNNDGRDGNIQQVQKLEDGEYSVATIVDNATRSTKAAWAVCKHDISHCRDVESILIRDHGFHVMGRQFVWKAAMFKAHPEPAAYTYLMQSENPAFTLLPANRTNISKRTVDDAGFPTEAQVCCLDHCPNGYSRFAETLFQVKGVQLLPPSDEHAKYAIPCPGRDAAHNYDDVNEKFLGTDVDPVAREICKQDVTIWSRLGAELRVDERLLEIIDSAQPHGSPIGCCKYMLHLWMDSKGESYKMELITALVNIQQLTACRDVKRVLK